MGKKQVTAYVQHAHILCISVRHKSAQISTSAADIQVTVNYSLPESFKSNR